MGALENLSVATHWASGNLGAMRRIGPQATRLHAVAKAICGASLGLALSACVDADELHYERYVPEEIALGPMIFAGQDFLVCAAQVFVLDASFTRRLKAEGIEALANARTSRGRVDATSPKHKYVTYEAWQPLTTLNTLNSNRPAAERAWYIGNECLDGQTFGSSGIEFRELLDEYYFGNRAGYATVARNDRGDITNDVVAIFADDALVFVTRSD